MLRSQIIEPFKTYQIPFSLKHVSKDIFSFSLYDCEESEWVKGQLALGKIFTPKSANRESEIEYLLRVPPIVPSFFSLFLCGIA